MILTYNEDSVNVCTTIIECARQAERDYTDRSSFIVKPSIPILFFGDYVRYSNKSDLKVLTLGLNPSASEFQAKDRPWYWRFPAVEHLSEGWSDDEDCIQTYLRSLCDYFAETAAKKPYKLWFNNTYDKKLQKIGSSYYRIRGVNNTALHVDLCTPIATTLPWSKLEKKHPRIARGIETTGSCICKRLIEEMNPDVIFAYFKKARLESAFKFSEPWSDFGVTQKISAMWNRLSNGALIVQGDITRWNSETQKIVADRIRTLTPSRKRSI